MPVTRAMSLLRPIEARGLGMAERLLTVPRGKVPHHGAVTPECPVECLLTVLSLNTLLTELARSFPQFRHGAGVGGGTFRDRDCTW